jgi:sugar/nucleoside kinase (ribokinase family)
MLTRFGKGVLWGCSAGLLEVPAVPVLVVHAVGAGDAFNAGLAVGLSEKKSTLEKFRGHQTELVRKETRSRKTLSRVSIVSVCQAPR